MRNRVQSSSFLALALLALVLITRPPPDVHGQATSPQPHFTMTVTGQSLTAGFNNTVTISLTNTYYTGTVYDTDISVSVPSTLTLVGDNHRHYNSIALGQTVNITLYVYAPTSAIGSTIQGTVTATYRQLGDISYTQESHAVSFTVYGFIKLAVYGIVLTPATTPPGGNTTISGNLLNSGNLAALNATVTVVSDTLVPNSLSSSFVGEVDPNIPRPFSLVAFFKPTLAQGNYSITVRVSAIDNSRPGIPIIGQQAAQIQIKRPTQQPITTRQQGTSLIDMIYRILRDLFNAFLGSLTGIQKSPNWFALDYSYFEPRSFIHGYLGQVSVREYRHNWR